jgi:hypothetical protein
MIIYVGFDVWLKKQTKLSNLQLSKWWIYFYILDWCVREYKHKLLKKLNIKKAGNPIIWMVRFLQDNYVFNVRQFSMLPLAICRVVCAKPFKKRGKASWLIVDEFVILDTDIPFTEVKYRDSGIFCKIWCSSELVQLESSLDGGSWFLLFGFEAAPSVRCRVHSAPTFADSSD